MTNITQSQCEQHALGQFLACWPESFTFTEILECIRNDYDGEDHIKADEDTIGIWEPFEHESGANIAEWIRECYESTMRLAGFNICPICSRYDGTHKLDCSGAFKND
jgi:hypothetical protein